MKKCLQREPVFYKNLATICFKPSHNFIFWFIIYAQRANGVIK